MGLCLAAAAGIVLANSLAWGSAAFVFVFCVCMSWWALRRKSLPIYIGVAAAFGSIFLWQTRESPSFALASSLPPQGLLASLAGAVVDEPMPYGQGRVYFPLQVKAAGESFAARPQVLVVLSGLPPRRGDLVELTGRLAAISGPRNPGAFNSQRWMAQRGIFAMVEVVAEADIRITRSSSPFGLYAVAERCRDWMLGTLRSGISSDNVVSDLIAGMVLGVTSSIPDSLQDSFRMTGTFHLFSVSGLHVGMIGVLLWQMLKLFGVRRKASVVLIIPALFFYVLVTGWNSASVRAAVMAAIFLIGMASSRQPLAINSLCAAGFVILAGWSSELFSPGFQFSFVVVAAILLLAEPFHSCIRRVLHPDPFMPLSLYSRWQKSAAGFSEHFGGLCAVSLAAWIGSLPLTLGYFHLVSISALPANLAIIPIAFLIMATAVFSLVGGLASAWLSAVFNNANWVFTNALLLVVQAAASMPGSHFFVGSPPAAPIVVTVFDFGRGGAVAIEAGGRLWMVDSGPSHAYDAVLKPWLQSRGRSAPDGLLLTHGDAGHIGSMEMMALGRPTPMIVETMLDDRSPVRGRFHRALQAAQIPKSLQQAGDCVPVASGVWLEILYPPAGIVRDAADDKTFVLRLVTPEVRLLLLSDSGSTTHEWLLSHMRDSLEADVLIIGRHRSGLSPESSILDAVRPSLIIATAAGFPKSEAMNESWQARVAKTGARVFRQDHTGAVTLLIAPHSLSAQAYFTGENFSMPLPRK